MNPAVDQGQSTSVIAGIWAIDPKSDGVLLLTGDQPTIRPELINSLLERFENSTALIVAPSFQGQIRNPILFRRDLFPKILQLTGDRGRPRTGRGILQENGIGGVERCNVFQRHRCS